MFPANVFKMFLIYAQLAHCQHIDPYWGTLQVHESGLRNMPTTLQQLVYPSCTHQNICQEYFGNIGWEHSECYWWLHIGNMMRLHLRCAWNVFGGNILGKWQGYIPNVLEMCLVETWWAKCSCSCHVPEMFPPVPGALAPSVTNSMACSCFSCFSQSSWPPVGAVTR